MKLLYNTISTTVKKVGLIILLLWAVPAYAQNNQPYYPIDSVNPASQTYGSSAYPLQLFDSIDLEAAQRWYEQCPGNQVSVTANASACLGTTGAGLTMTPTACVAYNEGLRMTETGSIVFPNASTCWVAVDPNTSGTNAGLPNFGRVAGTHYLTDCIDVSAPSMPANAQLVMKVVTSGGSITAVTDLRTIKAACGSGGTPFTGAATDATVQGNGLPATPLSVALTPISSLAPPAANINYSSLYTNNNMVAASTSGQPLIYAQSAARLHDLLPNASTVSMQVLGALLGVQFDVNNEYNPSDPFFGADATGTNDSAIAITNALAAATANATSNTYAASTKLSGGTYKLNEPILISSAWIPSVSSHVAPIQLLGAGEFATQFTTGMTAGPMIVAMSGSAIPSANNGNPIKQAALVTGSSGSAQWASNGQGNYSFDLQELLGTQSVNGDNGLDVRGFYNPSISSPSNPEVLDFSGAGIDYWSSSRDSTLDGLPGAFAAYRGTDNKLHCQVTTSVTGFIQATSSNTFTTSAVNEYECAYNGADLYAILKGTASTGTAGTGTIVQRRDEMMILGGAVVTYGFGEGWHDWPAGLLDSPEIASVARNVANYIQHTAAYPGDGSSVVLFKGFGTNLNLPVSIAPAGGPWPWAFEPNYLKGTLISATSGQPGQAWVEAKTAGIGCCGSQIELGNFDIVGGTSGLASQVAALKAHDIAVEGSESYIGIETTTSSYNSSFRNIDEGMGELGFAPAMSPMVIGGGITIVDSLHAFVGYMGPYLGGASLTNSYISPSSSTLFGLVCDGTCYINNVNEDSENGGAFPGIDFVGDPGQGTASYEVDNTIIEQQGNGQSPIKVGCSNIMDLKFTHDNFNVQNNSLTSEVNNAGCSVNQGNPIVFDNVSWDGGGSSVPPSGVTYLSNPTHQTFEVRNMGAGNIPAVYAASGPALPSALTTQSANAAACVSDSTLCTAGTTYVSGGTTKCELNWSGTAWIETGVGYCM